jgi:outer membrane protein assembly factor BamB
VLFVIVVGCASAKSPTPTPTADVGGDWPMYRGDLARDGHPAEATLNASVAKHLKAAWQVEMSGAINGTPAVAGGMVFAASGGGVVAAYRLDSGAMLWQLPRLGAIFSSPTVAAGQVIVGTLTGHVIAIGLDGTLRWDSTVPGFKPAIWSSPTVYGQLVLAGVSSQYGDEPLEDGAVIAFDLATGSQMWELCARVVPRAGCVVGDGIWSTPAIDAAGRGYVGVGNPDDGVLAFEVATGKPLWFTSFHTDAGRDVDVGATPIVLQLAGREVIAVGSNAGVFKVLDSASGAVVWSRDLVNGSAVHGLLASPGYDGNYFYIPSAGTPSGLYALAVTDGKTAWTNHAGLPIYSAPAIGKGVVVFGTGDVFGDPNEGGMVALSSRDGTVLWTNDLHSAVFSGPAISGNTVLVGDSRGDLIAFRPA